MAKKFINGIFNVTASEPQSLNGTITSEVSLTGNIMQTILRGVGIKSIEQIQSSTESSGENIWLITLTDDTKYSLSVFNGEKGETPYLGNNGNWFIGDVDTGIRATEHDYKKLINKPTINGIEIDGNLLIESLSDEELDEILV